MKSGYHIPSFNHQISFINLAWWSSNFEDILVDTITDWSFLMKRNEEFEKKKETKKKKHWKCCHAILPCWVTWVGLWQSVTGPVLPRFIMTVQHIEKRCKLFRICCKLLAILFILVCQCKVRRLQRISEITSLWLLSWLNFDQWLVVAISSCISY